jgi:hypothetical protein
MDNQIDKRSKKTKGWQADTSNDIKVNFKFDDHEPVIKKYMPSVKKNSSRKYYDSNTDILDQSQFKFILNLTDSKNNSWVYSYGFANRIKWEDINSVIYYSVEAYTCPICLEQKLVCPKITRCGHIFCWPCLDSYFDYWTNLAVNKKIPHCPLCMEKINIHQIKFCKILQSVNYSETESQLNSNVITFNLIMRDKKAPILYNVFHDPNLEYCKTTNKDMFSFIPLDNQEEFSFSRIFLTTPLLLLKRYSNIKFELQDALKEEFDFYADERKIQSINKCIEAIENRIKSLKDNNKDLNSDDEEAIETPNPEEIEAEEEKLDYKEFEYFYQEQYGDIYYLHPIDYTILLTEYINEESLPTIISVLFIKIG